jgi:hypothetical protein
MFLEADKAVTKEFPGSPSSLINGFPKVAGKLHEAIWDSCHPSGFRKPFMGTNGFLPPFCDCTTGYSNTFKTSMFWAWEQQRLSGKLSWLVSVFIEEVSTLNIAGKRNKKLNETIYSPTESTDLI